MPRFTKLERIAIAQCLSHCEAAGTELDFYDNLKREQGEKYADKVIRAIASAMHKAMGAGWGGTY